MPRQRQQFRAIPTAASPYCKDRPGNQGWQSDLQNSAGLKLPKSPFITRSNASVAPFLGFVELRDAGANLTDLGADVHGEFQQFVRADDALGGLDLTDAHFDFGKILDANSLRGCRCGSSSGAARGGCAPGRGAVTGEGCFCASFSMASILSMAS